MQQKRKGSGFKTEWTVSGDATARTITLPLANSGIFNCTVDWGDGSEKSIITAYNDSDRIHTYASDGIYEVEITGNCPAWSFSNGGDKLKITKIVYWGDVEKFTGFVNWAYAFYGCSNLTSLGTITNWVTSIAVGAFWNCGKLTGTVTLPDTCTSIGEAAFRGTAITGINLGSGMKTIGNLAFFAVSTLTGTLTLPSTMLTIGNSAFLGCPITGNINIPIGVTSLGANCFNGNNFSSASSDNLSYPAYDNVIYDVKTSGEIKAIINARGYVGSLTFRSDTTSILTDGFPKRTGSLTIPIYVTYIGASAFLGSSGFTNSITIPYGVTYIGASAFQACSNITGVTIPSGITQILTYAFWNCGKLTGTVTLPDTCTSIGEAAFRGTAITGINLGSGMKTIGNLAFFAVSTLTGTLTLPSTMLTIGNSAFLTCTFNRVNSYASTAPTVAANGFVFGGSARPLHIPTGGGTGYNVAPWTTATIFTQPAIADL